MKYHFNSHNNMEIEYFENFIQKLSRCFIGIAEYFGLSAGIPLLSAYGFFGIAAIVLAFVLLLVSLRACKRIPLLNEQHILPVFFIASVVCNISVFVIVNRPVVFRFFIPFMILYIPLTAILFEYAETNYGLLKRTALISGIVLFIFGQGFLNFHSLAARDVNSIRENYIQYLLKNQLNFGFASFWNANVTSELANGSIAMVSLESPGNGRFNVYKLLVPVQYLDGSSYSGESFLLFADDEWESVKYRSLFSGIKPDYQDGNFVIIRYPSAESIYGEFFDQ